MDIFDIIKNRRAVRKYHADEVPKEEVDKLLEAGIWAPSGMNAQPVRFVVVQDREILNKLSGKVRNIVEKKFPDFKLREVEDPIFYKAPLLIILSANKNGFTPDVDCALAAQNMMLAARSMDLGSCYVGFACFLEEDTETKKELGIPESHKIVAPLIFGRGEFPEPKPRSPPKILNWFKGG